MIRSIIKKHRLKFAFTLLLILMEAFLTLLFPLFIGMAIDTAIGGHYSGAIQLGILGLFTLLVGVIRRVFDSRFYAMVYQKVSPPIIYKMGGGKSSVKSARLGMIGELVEFLENTLPELINTMINLVGVIVIIAALNIDVFYCSLVVTAFIFLIYLVTSSKTIELNKSSNDELEKQVDILSEDDHESLKDHLRNVMKWNIKLSDMEAINFSLSWLVLISFLVGSILLAINGGVVAYGILLSLIMYVFQYIESVVNLPLFYQNWLRLKEIKARIESG